MKYVTISLLFFLISSLHLFAQDVKTGFIEIQNKKLSVKILLTGAEIISIFNKDQKFEHIWQGEKKSWNQHAPILFPIVGKLKNGAYQVDGNTYKMKNHGFAFKSLFHLVSKTNTEVVLELKSNPETLKMYPFKFRLLVAYRLEGNKLTIQNHVENTDTKEMYFSIGAHPGFNIPFRSNEKYDDYYLEFDQNEIVNRLPLTKEKGLLSSIKIENYLNNSDKLRLNHPLFNDRAVILEGLQSKTVMIKSDHSKMKITIGIEGFPFFGVWTASKKDAPFICIEPWYGISDVENSTGNFKTKKGIQKLNPKKQFTMRYFIEIN